jgi:hypothetical protein
MTRTYAARKLLEHGPLTLSEFLQITRWPYRTAQRTLENLQEVGLVVAESCGPHRNLYRLA